MTKTIIVTGGAGFIGSHLCDRLIEHGDTVICLDNLLTGSLKNIAHLINRKKFFFFNHDATIPFKSRKFARIDEIYHLASPADPNVHSPMSYIAHPFETMLVNSVGTWNICELASKHKAKLLFASTSEVYGDPQIPIQDESYRGNVSTVGPRAVYDESKRFGETIVSTFVREKKMDGRITRIFNTYGPRMNPNEGRAVVNFIKQALGGEPITVYGNGKQTRSFCYIDDQVEGQMLTMEKGKAGEVYNIGNDDERTILEFAKLIKKFSNSQSPIVFSKTLPEDDPHQRRPDLAKTQKELGFRPRVDLKKGLSKTIDYFRQNLL